MTPSFTIKIYVQERVKDGLRVTRYTAEQAVGEKYMRAESYDGCCFACTSCS